VQGAGGAGRTLSDLNYGGSGGGYAYFYSDVLETEWGTSITNNVGSAVADANGGASTMTGTLNGVGFVIVAGGGRRLGGGGTALGGATNISGYDGVEADVETGTDGTLGLAGGYDQDLSENGGNGGVGSSTVLPAEDGYIVIEWS
jgi:hypothetical protein